MESFDVYDVISAITNQKLQVSILILGEGWATVGIAKYKTGRKFKTDFISKSVISPEPIDLLSIGNFR